MLNQFNNFQKIFLAPILFFVFFALAQNSQAAPSISGISGLVIHGQNITITGSSFGVKNPAVPLWWDDGEGATDNNLIPRYGNAGCSSNSWITSATLSGTNKCYNDVQPINISQDSGAANIRYRNAGYRSVEAPHGHSTKYITGGHDDEGECLGGEPGQDVGVVVGDDSRHDIWFVHYYLRLDPLWPINDPQNYKFFDVSTNDPATRPTMYSNSTGATYIANGPCGCGADPRSRTSPNCGETWWCGAATDMLILNLATCPAGASPTCYGDIIVKDYNKPNPIYQWTREEWQVNYATQKLKFSVNNAFSIDTTQDADCSFNLTRLPNAISAFTIGGFWKEKMCENGQDDLNDDAWRYFDDIYVDNTFSRVMLANNATYANATIIEPQIPSAWTDGSVTVEVNAGKIGDGQTAYLFVCDENNDCNATGFEVTLNGEPDVTAPNAPTGLSVQ